MGGINDEVLAWGAAQSPALTSYDEAKRALIADRTNQEVITAASDDHWNEAMIVLAGSSVATDFLLLELGDFLLLESGDKIVLD